MESLQGHLLVASPHLPDTNFFRSVVLMIHHDDDGAFGVILNRPTSNCIREIWEMVSAEPCPSDAVIYRGGPVDGPLMVLHTLPEWSETEILPGLHMATQKDYLRCVIADAQRPYRLFSGYAGWGQGQLESELEAGGWLTTPASSLHVFDCAEELWKKVSQSIGLDILGASLRMRHLPDDPTVN